MAYQIGDRIGDYEVIGVLGTGGMGQVYKVRNVISERLEAMKILLPNLEHDPALADRFLREIKVLAALDHPNIAALHTAFRAGNQLVMVMELVEGVSLDERLRQGPIPLGEAINYFCQALAALHYAHSRGVIHRDIKPANIMVTPQGAVKLMDFGIAKAAGDRQLTRTGTTLGSLYYMSPEQVTGGALDARSDIYSMGVALYEVLTGARPFQGDSEFSIMAAHLEGKIVPPIQINPLLGPALNELIMIALAKDPAQRFQSAEAFRTALEQVGKTLGAAVPLAATQALAQAPAAPQPAPPAQPAAAAAPPPPPPPPAPASGHRGLYMALGAVVAIALLAVAATQLPRWLRTGAAPAQQTVMPPQQEPEVATPAQAQPQTLEPQPPTPAPPSGPAGATPAGAAPSPAAPAGPAARPPARPRQTGGEPPAPAATPGGYDVAPRSTPAPAAPSQPPAAPSRPPASEQALQQLQQQMVMLASRAGAVRTSLETLQRQQAAMGLSLRGDISASWKRMEYYLDQAEAALGKGDEAGARRHLEAAERELDRLETFLGR
jgi:hypothetical protein